MTNFSEIFFANFGNNKRWKEYVEAKEKCSESDGSDTIKNLKNTSSKTISVKHSDRKWEYQNKYNTKQLVPVFFIFFKYIRKKIYNYIYKS